MRPLLVLASLLLASVAMSQLSSGQGQTPLMLRQIRANQKPKSEQNQPATTSKQQQAAAAAASASSSSTQNNKRSIASPSNVSSQATSASSARLVENFAEDELPADFYEMPPEQLDLGMNATGRAPVPQLNVAVLQNGQLIDSAVTVHPGTPLEMVIYLDDKSAKVYGLLASYLKVQDDTFRQREEVIILNGCSIDTYIFGNFELNPEDQSLRAKFRAFKFPDSNFVRFIGTVNVCIKQCAKVNCNGASRRKRSSQSAALLGGATNGVNGDQNKRLVLTVSTVLKISNSPA